MASSAEVGDKAQSEPAQSETAGDDVAVNEEEGSSTTKSVSVPSFHAPVGSDDDEALATAQQLALERMQDSVEERNFQLGQRLKKSVFLTALVPQRPLPRITW